MDLLIGVPAPTVTGRSNSRKSVRTTEQDWYALATTLSGWKATPPLKSSEEHLAAVDS